MHFVGIPGTSGSFLQEGCWGKCSLPSGRPTQAFSHVVGLDLTDTASVLVRFKSKQLSLSFFIYKMDPGRFPSRRQHPHSPQQKVPLSLLTVTAFRMETGSPAYPRRGSGECMAGAQCVLLSVSANQSHLPLKVFVELLAETVDAGPVQLLVQGICGSVCRSRGSQYGRVGLLPPLTLSCNWHG